MKLGLILSGRYVVQSLSAELGKLPASFVPLGNERLLYKQINFLRKFCDQICVTLPNDFVLEQVDYDKIRNAEVTILYTDPHFEIGKAINVCNENLEINFNELLILYGDTLFDNIDYIYPNSIAVHQAKSQYDWAIVKPKEKPSEIHSNKNRSISGLFNFSNPKILFEQLKENDDCFLSTIYDLIDKNLLSCESPGQWYDFGHLQTYYRSVGLVTTERSFNQIKFKDQRIEKYSENFAKIEAEVSWYENLPEGLRLFTPAYLGRISDEQYCGYAIENTFLTTLSNLLVFGRVTDVVWVQILTACAEFMEACKEIKPLHCVKTSLSTFVVKKTFSRLDQLKNSEIGRQLLNLTKFDGRQVPHIEEIIITTETILRSYAETNQVIMHGDLCFSNIFYDFRSEKIKVIDPRGYIQEGVTSNFGFWEYDLAKLCQSIYGNYDLIIAGYNRYSLSSDELRTENCASNSKLEALHTAFEKVNLLKQLPEHVLISIIIHLYISMIALHSDRPDRQIAMYAEVYKIYGRLAN
jgi:hypothetical protein